MNYAHIIAEHGKALGATGLAVLVAFTDYPGSTYAEVAKMLDMGESTVKRDVGTLESLGLLRREFNKTDKGLAQPTTVYPATIYRGESDKPRQDISPSITYRGTDPAITERVAKPQENNESGLSDPAIRYRGKRGTPVAPYKDLRTSTDNSQPTAEEVADAPPPSKGKRARKSSKSKADPRSKHRAIQAIKGLMSRYPDKILYDDLIELIGESPDMLRLARCRKLWLKKSHNPNSVGWTDWYAPGILEAKEAEYAANGRPQAGGAGNQQNGRNGGVGRRDANLAELRRQGEEVTFDWTPSAVDDKGSGYKARSH